MKIQVGIGTVQLGIPYGNQPDLMPESQAFDILDATRENGIRFFDTAAAYGQSESRIGQYLKLNPEARNFFHISTKIPRVDNETWDDTTAFWDFVRKSLDESFFRLGISNLDLLQFHQCDEKFLTSASVKEVMKRIVNELPVKRLGVSVYTPIQATLALDIPEVSALQIPVNLVDTRFLSHDLKKLYNQKNVFLIVRSVFLQGVLVSGVGYPLVKKQSELIELRSRLERLFETNDLASYALGFVFKTLANEFDIGLLGTDRRASLEQNLKAIKLSKSVTDSELLRQLDDLRDEVSKSQLFDPSQWNL